jgi:competence protein ComEA
MRRFTFAIGMLIAALAVAAGPISAQAPKRPAAAKATASATAPVNLNTATLAQLQTLPRIGAATAQRIVEYRQKNGNFKKIEELMNVKGIGEKNFLKLKPLITVGSEKADRPEGRR